MIIAKNSIHTFVVGFGRRWGSKTVRYRLLDASFNEITTWSTTGIQDLTKGRYGIILTLDNALVTFLQFYLVERTQYRTFPVSIQNSAGNQSFVANFTRTGKTVQYRILDEDKVELIGWTAMSEIPPATGYYGVVRPITSDMKFIQFYDVEDVLYLSDSININLTSVNTEEIEITVDLDSEIATTVELQEIATTVDLGDISTTVDLDSEIAVEVALAGNIDVEVEVE